MFRFLQQKPTASPLYVQACITNVSFPQEPEGLKQMLHKNEFFGAELTDLDLLLSFPERPGAWTAPRWMTEGDLLFFYHAATTPQRIARLRRALEQQCEREQPEHAKLARVLERAALQATTHAGRLFAVAEVSDRPSYERLPDDERHFRGRIFAPFERVVHLEQRVPIGDLAAIGITINRQSALTPLEGAQFSRLKELLAQQQSLPAILANALPGGKGFRDVSASTWRAISCAPDQRFVHEGQVRSYLIDYLLDETKDPQTALLEECDCYCGATATGRADYFVSINGRWVPVEAKLNIEAERALPGQLTQYTRIDSFMPTLGKRRNEKIATVPDDVCLVVDQLGLYLTRAGLFMECTPRRPFLSRVELERLSGAEVRARLLPLLTQ
jgi:hypothetical protein